ncbi:gamma-tubulin complex component 3 homolog [Watersipora subatra]|uniref:gamma-tubulin complex component 3 homolog n=1 Tax=Watersipora subatra TaxID=2589382 RepID=UPI00355C3DDC
MADGVEQLTRLLIRSTLGRDCDNRLTSDLQRLCLKLINGSDIGSESNVSKVEKHLAATKNVKIAADFSRKYKELERLNTLTRASHLVEFLHLVGVNSSRKQAFNHGVRQSSTPLHTQLSAVQKSSSHFDMTPAHPIHPHSQYHRPPLSLSHSTRGGIAEAPVSGYHQSGSSSGLGTSRASTSHNLSAGDRKTQATPVAGKILAYKELFKDDVLEEELVKDVILVAQGLEGRLAKYDPKAEAYRFPENLRISTHKRNMCHKLFEAGWLYNKISSYVEMKKADITFGPIGLSFCVALQQEIRCYLRLVAVLDAQVKAAEAGTGDGLTLQRLQLWLAEPITSLTLAAALTDMVKGKKGGALLSIIHSYTLHGALSHTSMVSNMLTLTVKPLYGVINRWIYTGILEDPYNEFFVAADPQVKDENLWHFKYSLRRSMIPSFLSADMARKIMLTGKSVVFIHRVCHDNAQLEQLEAIRNARLNEGSPMFNQENDDSFKSMIDITYRVTSKHLMEVLYNKYNFINHLKAMRRYLLLGQGDFIQQLMDLLVTELSRDASALYQHNLNGILETAIRATNAQYEDKDILSRLDVRLLEISPGDLGWDVFSLDYRTRGPISTVFTHDTMIFYLRIFNFLWRAKRMEYALANLWRLKQEYSRRLRGMSELDDLLHSAHVIASEMIHFTQQIGYYINFEVIECAWDDLLRKVDKAEDLDHIIAAHQQFLDSIITRCLMDQVHRDVFSQLRTIFDLIIKFQQILEGFFEKASRENDYRQQFEKGMVQRTSESEWGTTEEREAEEKERRTEFLKMTIKPTRSQLKVLSQAYQDMVTKFLVMLATQADDKLQALRFRLDFNEHYQAKEPILASPQVLKKYQPRTATLLPGAGVSQPVGGLVGVLGGRVPDAVQLGNSFTE